MKYEVRLTPQARHQLAAIDDWWLSNRRDAPELFSNEMIAALERLSTTASLGKRYPALGGYRRLLLRRSRFHIYYRIDEQMQEVWIVAIWNSSRGQLPRMK